MLIDHRDNLFVATCTYDERLAFKGAGWRWNPELRRWVTDDVGVARNFAPFATDAALAAIEGASTRALSALDLSAAIELPFEFTVPAPAGQAYDRPQLVAIYYAFNRRDTLCADPPGLGKTIVAAGLCNRMEDASRVLIVPPSHLKRNWAREWRKWDCKNLTLGTAESKSRTTSRTRVEGEFTPSGRPKFKTTSVTDYIWPDTQVVICSYDSLPDFAEQIRAVRWDLLIADEAHYLITEGTIRTRNVLGGGKQRKKSKGADGKIKLKHSDAVAPIAAGRRLFLTGTPIMSRPSDVWPLCKSLDPEGLGKNWISFTRRYCDGQKAFGRYDTSGASNLDELQVKMRLAFMVRRDKEKALAFLPPKRRQLIELPAEGLAKLVDREVSAMRQVRDALADFEGMLRGEEKPAEIEWTNLADMLERRFGQFASLDYIERAKHLTPPEQIAFEELSVARKELSAAKVPMVVEHLNNLLSSGEKVICFVVHKEMAEALWHAFPSCAFITGKTPMHKRQDQVDRFQERDECRLMVGNFIAAGTGYTMTAARLVVCAEMDWVPAIVEQAEDRAWRRGQRNAVLAQHLAVEGTADARLVEVMLGKQQLTREALDFAALGDVSKRKDLLFAS